MRIDSPRGSPEPPVCLSPPSSPDKEAGGPSRLLRQPENEPIPFPPSQVSLLGSLVYVHTMLPTFSWRACLFILKAGESVPWGWRAKAMFENTRKKLVLVFYLVPF